ncbi:MAG: bifunctional diaminohydroxyphosphoribosylaminopyrimidine deaminase/5-amino-6-(5-phosphoribosylamino)uracil reductase RibD [Maribacter sp.]|nr:bifunctional diaminohydroxyphosphoribosylaminopyrimidine deaminase/5-amino-6-(5-phosphoribosylamino)uracil reductase RibD [Maribacter sp.]
MSFDPKYMERALQLAKNGLGSAAPNPAVGSVIVHDNCIIGEGYTSAYGGWHAEVNAINSVKNKRLLSEAVLYVTLEPCSHHGKTPPCADLILKYKIPKVVIGILDPHDKVAGKGVKQLKNSGCTVVIGVLEKACMEHHRRFLTFHKKQRPYIILKWAQSNDGYIAPEKNKRGIKIQPYWISNKYSRQLVHKWRSQEQAVLIGMRTVIDDNPKLNVRQWFGKSPIRIVIDKELTIKGNHHILDQSQKTIIFTAVEDKSQWINGIDYELMDFTKNRAQQICDALHKHNIMSLLIEGGTKTLQSFIDAALWDEARVVQGSANLGDGLKAPKFNGNTTQKIEVVADILTIYQND